MKTVLAIAGSDSSGAAGLQCDVKTISTLGLHALSVVTSVTSQTSEQVCSLDHIAPLTVQSQLTSAFSNYKMDAVKSGMIPTQESVEEVSDALRRFHASKPYVLDPVLSTTSGTVLMSDFAAGAVMDKLFPLATIVTPNIHEAEKLSGDKISTRTEAVKAGRRLLKLGSRYVLVKGGHLVETPGLDILIGPTTDSRPQFLDSYEFIRDRDVRGTGCAYASAIACGLANGLDISASVNWAKNYITRAIQNATCLTKGTWILTHTPERWTDQP